MIKQALIPVYALLVKVGKMVIDDTDESNKSVVPVAYRHDVALYLGVPQEGN